MKLDAIKSRLGALPEKKMLQILDVNPVAWRLLAQDMPALLAEVIALRALLQSEDLRGQAFLASLKEEEVQDMERKIERWEGM